MYEKCLRQQQKGFEGKKYKYIMKFHTKNEVRNCYLYMMYAKDPRCKLCQKRVWSCKAHGGHTTREKYCINLE